MVGSGAKWAYLDAQLPLAMAHRGAHMAAPENSWRSFSAAQQLGYKYIETDVRGTADRKVVVFHDADSYRITGLRMRIANLTLKQLRAAGQTASSTADLPLLEETLHEFPELRFNIDLKDSVAAAEIPGILQRTNSYDRVCITSFSARRIRQARLGLERAVCTGAGVADVAKFLISPAARTRRSPMAVLQLPLAYRKVPLVGSKLIARAHDAGLQVHVWTLNDRASIRKALDLGVDGIVTDEPILLKDELAARGLWVR